MTTRQFDLSRLKQVYDIEVEVVSPTQAGSGARLLPEIDYFEDQRGMHVVNIANMLADEGLAARLFSAGGRFRLSELARQDNAVNKYITYTTNGRANGQEIVGHVRDGAGKPYLPGSSLKGAFRTLLGWDLYQAEPARINSKLNLKAVNRNDPRRKERADDNIENALFVNEKVEPRLRPNYDLLKTMLVEDLYPVQPQPLQLEDVQIFVRGRDGRLHPKNRPIVAEMLKERTVFRGRLILDTFFLNQEKLGFDERAEKIRQLCDLGRNRADKLINTEMDFIEGCERDDSSDNLYDWYDDLLRALDNLSADEFLVPLGWSTGWNGKTYAENLAARKDFSQSPNGPEPGLRQTFELGHWENPQSPFPISRKAIVNRQRVAQLPAGWLRVRLTPRAN